MIRININDPSYKALRIYSHELDRYHYINVAFFDNGDNVELSGLTVKASITCDGFVVAENVGCSYITEGGVDGVRLNIATNDNFTILSGKMKIEFSIKNGDVIVHPVAPLVIDIMPSILDNAQVTPESLGTFSQIAQEVVDARGEFNTLDERLDTPITTAKLADKAVTAEKLNPALASRIFLKQDSNINISEATTVGSYRVNLDSLSSLNLDLPYGATINNYYWSCYVFKPSTLNNSDVTQVLIGHHQATNETVIFTRTSINKVFRSFIKIHPVYTANASEPIAINEALNTGTYPVINATLSSFNTALRLKWGTTYENYDWYVKVDKIDDTITQQILYGYSTNDTTYAVCYYRRKSGNSFSTFRKLSSEFKNQFNATNIEDARDTGFYRINYNSLTELTLDLPSGRTINEYYWTCIVLRPSTLAGSDCMQRLMGHSQSGNEYVEFIRTSINGTFRTFTRIYPLETNAAGSVTNICFIGDSFTANRSDGTSFVNYLSNINKVYTNLGVSGTTPYSWYNKHENDITNDYDVFFVALGLNNDPNGNGTIDSTDPQTFVGGMRQIIEKIIATAPKARIIIWCMDSWYTESKSELCKQLAEIYGCEYYSMKASKEIPLRIGGKFANVAPNLSTDVISAKNNVYRVSSTDGHPNSVAQKMLATYLETVL